MWKLCAVIVAAFVLVIPAQRAAAQVQSDGASITLGGDVPESLSIGLSNSSVNFTLTPGSNNYGDSSVDISTSWTLSPSRTTIEIYGYFGDPSSALFGSYGTIPTSSVTGYVPTGTATSYTPFSQTSPFNGSGGSLLLISQSISGQFVGSRTDTLYMGVDLSGQTVPSGSYSGTLYIQAYAF